MKVGFDGAKNGLHCLARQDAATSREPGPRGQS